MSIFHSDASGRIRSGWVIAVFVVVAVGVGFAASIPAAYLGSGAGVDDPRVFFDTLPSLIAALAATLLCALVFKEPVGLAHPSPAKQWTIGVLLGLGMLAAATVVPSVVGVNVLRFTGAGSTRLLTAGVQQLVCLAPAAIGEELLLRGVPLRALSRGTHPVFAVALTGSVFGALHLTNPNATWIAAVNVALVGLWFGALTVRTGSLWLSLGLHAAWNWAEGFLFGQPVSGMTPGTAVFTSALHEAGFWSGGAFGPEASGWTAVLLASATAITVLVPKRPVMP